MMAVYRDRMSEESSSGGSELPLSSPVVWRETPPREVPEKSQVQTPLEGTGGLFIDLPSGDGNGEYIRLE